MSTPASREVEHAAAAHYALLPVARLLARDAPPEDVYATVVERLGRMLGVRITSLLRYDADDTMTVCARWTDGAEYAPVGTRWPLEGDNLSTRVLRSRRPERIDDYATATGPIAQPLQALGIRSVVGAPVIVADDVWGLLVASSSAEDPMPPETEERIATFAELTAVDIASAEARRELTASRERLVAAADEARRSFARDLHDGAQHRLAALAISLGLLERGVSGPAREQAAHARAEAQEALRELRELAHGLHPAVLTDHGLAAAIESLAEGAPVPVTVAAEVDRVPDPSREVAAYYVVSEALANAVKHAGASRVDIRAAREGDAVVVEVHDDGHGGADLEAGTGLRGLDDRVSAVGGTLVVESAAGAGTTVRARIPAHA